MTFEEYVQARGPALVRLARLISRDPSVAEDLVQEVLGRAYPRWSKILRSDDPDRQRATVVLRYYEDLDDARIGEILGCSASTVRTNAMRAMATLRARLDAPARSIDLRGVRHE